MSRHVDGGVEILRGCLHSLVRPAGTETHELTSGSEWWDLVIDHFGLSYGEVTAEERRALWTRVRRAHDEWLAAQS